MANQARLNGVEYEFLYTGSPMNPGALDVATNGDTVEVLEDIVFASTGSAGQRSSIYVYDKDITLDLRSHVLSFTATQDTNKATAIEFKNSKSTIKNGTIHTENGCGGVYADAGADLVLECNIDQNGSAAGQPFYRYAAITTANNTDAKITINSGNYSAENIAIMAKAGTSITVNNGVITSKNHNSDSDIINWDDYMSGDSKGFKAIEAGSATVVINGGVLGSSASNDIALGAEVITTGSNITINGGTFKGIVETQFAVPEIVDGTFQGTILPRGTGGHYGKYVITGGMYVDDVTPFLPTDRPEKYLVVKQGKNYIVMLDPTQPEDEDKYLNGRGLSLVWALLKKKFTLSGDEAIEIDNSEHTVTVLYNEEKALEVDSDNKLAVKIDGITVRFNSEGELESAAVKEGDAIKFTEEDGLTVVNVMFDSETIVLDSEGNLEVPIDRDTIVVNSEGKLAADISDLLHHAEFSMDSEFRLFFSFFNRADELVDSEMIDLPLEEMVIDARYEETSEGSEGEFQGNIIITLKNGVERTIPLHDFIDGLVTLHTEQKIDGDKNFVGKLYYHDDEVVTFTDIDNVTITINSEGKLTAAGVEPGIAIELKEVEGKPGINSINVMFDSETIVLNDLGELAVPIDSETLIIKNGVIEVPLASTDFIFNSAGEIELNTVEFGGLRKAGAYGYYVVADNQTVYLTSEGELFAKKQAYADEITLKSRPYIDQYGHVLSHTTEFYVPIDSETIIVTSEGLLATSLKVDNVTIIYNSEGALSVPIDNDTLIINSEGLLSGASKMFPDEITILEDENGVLSVPFDSETIIVNSEGKIEAVETIFADEVTIHKDEYGVLRVPIDYDTLIIDSEGFIASSVVPDEETIIYDDLHRLVVNIDNRTIIVDSEGMLSSPAGIINGVELEGDKNTEEIKITWFGTQEEYDALPEHNEYTLYIVDTSEGYITATPDYENLKNKPQINGVTLSGNKLLSEFDIQRTMQSGTAIGISNDSINLKYAPGILGINTSNELFADSYSTAQVDSMIASMRTIKVVNVKPTPQTADSNTVYYVATDDPTVYDVYLFDYQRVEHSLGSSQLAIYHGAKGIEITSTNTIYANMDEEVKSDATHEKMPTTKAVYEFLMGGATKTKAGTRGVVPAPLAGQQDACLRGDGTWRDILNAKDIGLCGGVASEVAGNYVVKPETDYTFKDYGRIIGIFPNGIKGGAKFTFEDGGTLQPFDFAGTSVTLNKEDVGPCIVDFITSSTKVGAVLNVTKLDRISQNLSQTAATPTSNVAMGNITYEVRDGVLYLNLDGVRLTASSNLKITTLPAGLAPKSTIGSQAIALNNNNVLAGVGIDTDGNVTLYARNGIYQYWGTVSYPIA